MDVSFSVDPFTIAMLSIGAPIAYSYLSKAFARQDRRIRKIELFLAERFGDPEGHFKADDED